MTTDNFCFYLQNRLIQTSQTGGQQYSDTSPFSIPCIWYWPRGCNSQFKITSEILTIIFEAGMLYYKSGLAVHLKLALYS
jgi:hypothetical protein